jgi:hypothetical protein
MNRIIFQCFNAKTVQEQANIESSGSLILDGIAFCAPLLLFISLSV